MILYSVEFTEDALDDVAKLKRSEPQAYKKLIKLLDELQDHPEIGTGHPKLLRGDKIGQWSRRITDKHRLVYTIDDDEVLVLVISAYGHYDDK